MYVVNFVHLLAGIEKYRLKDPIQWTYFVYLLKEILVFLFRAISDYYRDFIYPWTVPVLLPLAQISLTASVYTTVITCFDRYIAICRPVLLGK